MSRRVAVVTGSNKGIGFATVRALCKDFDGDVYLTARDVERGMQAVKDLENENLHPKFHQLDITSKESIDELKNFLERDYGGLDVLVNNAGMAYKKAATAPFTEQAEVTVACNFFGTLDVCRALFPLLRPHTCSRVVNVASRSGTMALPNMSAELVSRFKSSSLTESEVVSLMDRFVSDVKSGNHQEMGWSNTAYGTSKLGLIALTYVQARSLDGDPREDILVNACTPGQVNTDMNPRPDLKSPDEGARTILNFALLPPNVGKPQGEFFVDTEVIQWRTSTQV